jgi:hypothetical protein
MLRPVVLAALLGGCAAAPPPVPLAPPAPSATPVETPPAAASEEPAQRPLAVVPAAVPPPPATCAAFVAHGGTGCSSAGASSRTTIAGALATTGDPEARDALLACAEGAEDLPAGFVRALRAELAPEACADALVSPLLEAPPKGMTTEIESTLLGLMVSAQLSRLLGDPPKLEPPIDRARFMQFFAERLTPWVLSEAAAIEKLSRSGATLTGYGRGLAAIAAGNADLRFVKMVREAPLPDEMKADKSILDVYYGQLDEALEPRKVRGRDAALVGLKSFADLGAVSDERVARARSLLNELWAGSRIDVLDRLLLPDLEPLDTATPELLLAAKLPTFYAKTLLADADPTDPKLLRALLERGVPVALRPKLEAKKLALEAQLLYARGLIDSGRRFFRSGDFKQAHALLGEQSTSELGRFLAALALSLESGPVDATELMLKGPFVNGKRDLSQLDVEAAKRGRFAGLAAFDGGLILAIRPLQDHVPFWEEVAKRFTSSEKLLRSAPYASARQAASSARELADAARATVVSLRAAQSGKSPPAPTPPAAK